MKATVFALLFSVSIARLLISGVEVVREPGATSFACPNTEAMSPTVASESGTAGFVELSTGDFVSVVNALCGPLRVSQVYSMLRHT
jgi:hypothetical protein